MCMYEWILDIIEKNGPASLTSICHEMNQMEKIRKERNKPVQLSQIKSVVSRKKDLFSVNDDIVSIREEKEFISFSAHIGSFPGPFYQIAVNFKTNQFHIYERFLDRTFAPSEKRTIYVGSIEKFKKEIYRLRIWNWDHDYQPDSLVLDGTSWSVILRTKGKVYRSEGIQCFPKEWPKFRKALKELIGVEF